MTRYGVERELNKSPYVVRAGKIKYYFSSALHLAKFKENQMVNQSCINYSLRKKFKFCFVLQELADLYLYRKIETRGFLIEINGKQIDDFDNLMITGVSINWLDE